MIGWRLWDWAWVGSFKWRLAVQKMSGAGFVLRRCFVRQPVCEVRVWGRKSGGLAVLMLADLDLELTGPLGFSLGDSDGENPVLVMGLDFVRVHRIGEA